MAHVLAMPTDPITMAPMARPLLLVPCCHVMCEQSFDTLWRSSDAFPFRRIRCPTCRTPVDTFFGLHARTDRVQAFLAACHGKDRRGVKAALAEPWGHELSPALAELWSRYRRAAPLVPPTTVAGFMKSASVAAIRVPWDLDACAALLGKVKALDALCAADLVSALLAMSLLRHGKRCTFTRSENEDWRVADLALMMRGEVISPPRGGGDGGGSGKTHKEHKPPAPPRRGYVAMAHAYRALEKKFQASL